MKLKNLFRSVGLLEALSFLILVCIAMPLKYRLGMAEATKIPGMAHGLLFMLYIGLALQQSEKESWSKKQLCLAFLASMVPFGTLVFDWKFLSARTA